MSLSNWPDYLLIDKANHWQIPIAHNQAIDNLIDQELDLRKPNVAAWYFGDCDGQVIFIPNEPEYDRDGQPIVSEMIEYNEGEEVWS